MQKVNEYIFKKLFKFRSHIFNSLHNSLSSFIQLPRDPLVNPVPSVRIVRIHFRIVVISGHFSNGRCSENGWNEQNFKWMNRTNFKFNFNLHSRTRNMMKKMMIMAPMVINVAGPRPLAHEAQSDLACGWWWWCWWVLPTCCSTASLESSDLVSEAAETARMKQKATTCLKMHHLVSPERHILNEISGPTAVAFALSVLFMRSTQKSF